MSYLEQCKLNYQCAWSPNSSYALLIDRDMKKPIKLSREELLKLSKEELIEYHNSWSKATKKTFPLPPPIDYNSMTFDEAVIEAGARCSMFANKMDQDPFYSVLKGLTKNRPEEEEFQFFWSSSSPFSQWYKVNFKAPIFNGGHFISEWQKVHFGSSEIEFSSAEKYMMLSKAIICGDSLIAMKIMETDNVRKIKELGRQVNNFDEDVWEFHRIGVIYSANRYKFNSNPDLKEALIETSPMTLVEASPNDKIWGIGLTEDDERSKNRETWLGYNLLGEILTNLRNEFIKNDEAMRVKY